MGLETRLKNALIPRRYHHHVAPIRHRFDAKRGAPAELDSLWLAATVSNVFGFEPSATSHAPMGGYKTGSAYRLWVRPEGGRTRTLVFKNAALDERSYPAISGYPGKPGLAEWAVLSAKSGSIARFLPAVFDARAEQPDTHYQYLLEDLAWHHRPVQTDADVDTGVDSLGSVHMALARWKDESSFATTIRLDAENSAETMEFAKQALETFAGSWGDPETINFLEGWDDVVEAHLNALAVAERAPVRLLHGDFNRKNVFLPAPTGTGLKLVDWEWMAEGPAHADLASILKRSPWGSQRRAVNRFFEDDEALSPDENWSVYLWTRLQRSLIDAALHANQNMAELGHTASDVTWHVRRAEDVLATMVGRPTWRGPNASSSLLNRSTPRVTIGLPVYNGERFLEETIQSILDQTYTDFELVVSDNASTDSTQEIVARFASQDPRVKHIRRDETVGAHYNYNGILEDVESDYFKWAADDDLYAPDFLERGVAMLDAYPDSVLAYPHAVDIDETGKVLRDRPFGFDLTSDSPSDRFRRYQGAGNACLPIFGLHRTSALKKTELLGHYPASDRVLLAELATHGPWREIPEPLFFHREHTGRSVNEYPNIRMRGAWFTSDAKGPDVVYWKRLNGYESAIRRAPVSGKERRKLYFLLAKWIVSRFPDLVDDLIASARGKTSPRQDARTGGD